MSAFGEIAAAFQAIAAVIALLREAKDVLPDGPKRTSLEQSLEQAEKNSKLAEAQIAKALGYMLCRCAFPPQIMLKTGSSRAHGDHFQCPSCGSAWPPPDSDEAEFVEDYEP